MLVWYFEIRDAKGRLIKDDSRLFNTSEEAKSAGLKYLRDPKNSWCPPDGTVEVRPELTGGSICPEFDRLRREYIAIRNKQIDPNANLTDQQKAELANRERFTLQEIEDHKRRCAICAAD